MLREPCVGPKTQQLARASRLELAATLGLRGPVANGDGRPTPPSGRRRAHPAVARQIPTNRARGAVHAAGGGAHRETSFQQQLDVDPLIGAEMLIVLAHAHIHLVKVLHSNLERI